MAAFGEVEVDTRLEGGEAGLVEAGGLDLREGLRREVCERRAAPERERCARIMRGDQPLEPRDVELVRLDADEVARGTRHDPICPDRAAKRVNVHLEGVRRAPRGRLAPDPVDQAVGRDGLVRMEQQLSKQRAGPRTAERHRHVVVVKHLQRPQQAEFQALRPPPRPLKPSLGGS